MIAALLVLHLLVTLTLIGTVLIQRSEGGGLGIGSSQGMGSFMSGRGTANHLHARALAWRDNLPATYRALTAGELDEARAAALADVLGTTDPALARSIEAQLLPQAA